MFLLWAELSSQYLELSPPLHKARSALVLLSLVGVGGCQEPVEELGQVHGPDDKKGGLVNLRRHEVVIQWLRDHLILWLCEIVARCSCDSLSDAEFKKFGIPRDWRPGDPLDALGGVLAGQLLEPLLDGVVHVLDLEKAIAGEMTCNSEKDKYCLVLSKNYIIYYILYIQ